MPVAVQLVELLSLRVNRRNNVRECGHLILALVTFLSMLKQSHTGSDCDATIVNYGIIKSPNYPRNYSNNAACLWTIQAYEAADIFLQVRSFSTELGYDFVIFADARGLQLSLSGSQKRRTFTLSSPTNISFVSNGDVTDQGFEIEFRSIERCQDCACGAEIVGYGIIKSANYPGIFSSIIKCLWTLKAYAETDIYLEIRHFSTDLGRHVVLITDASGFELSLSGEQQPRNITLSSPVNVSFINDGNVTAQGFEMAFSSIARSTATDITCGGTIEENGMIRSPNYPENYFKKVNCTWNLRAVDAADVFLQVHRFSTQYNDYACIYDAFGFVLCLSGEQQPCNFTLSSPATISFISGDWITARGFSIEYSSVAHSEDSVCGGTYVGRGIIKSPNYPENYYNSARCFWTLLVYDAIHIFLQIQRFSTESVKDVVLIIDASGFQLSLSGQQLPRNITLSSPANISFISDGNVTAQGFEIEFSSVVPSQDSACGGLIVGHGSIFSPNYPEYYPNNLSCLWTVQPVDTADMFLQIRSFSTELDYDNVLITDSFGFWLLLSGQQIPRNVTLSLPANISFNSNGAVSFRGFEMEVSSIAKLQENVCGGVIFGNGIIKSPNYPENYLNNITCLWTVRAYDAADIIVQIRRFSTEQGYDFVRMTDAPGFQLSLSGQQQPRNFSLSSPANISFIADSELTAQEFEIEVSSITENQGVACGGTIVDYGVIKSPNYPGKYYNNVSCLWTLKSYEVGGIYLQLRSFSTESLYDYVQISDAFGAYLLLSGHQKPRNLTLSSPATILFSSDEIVTDHGFEMEFNSILGFHEKSAAEHDAQATIILASVIPVVLIFGAIAVTLGVLARKKRLNLATISACQVRQMGLSANDSLPPLAPRASEPQQESNYVSMDNLGVRSDDHPYANFFMHRDHTNTYAACETTYENTRVNFAS